MESYVTKKMDFPFKAKPSTEPKEGAAEMEAEDSDEPAEMSTDEMGSSVAAAVKSGDGNAIYEAIAKVVAHCGG